MTFRTAAPRTSRLLVTATGALAVTASLLLVPGGTAQAVTSLPPAVPLIKSLGLTGQVQDMVVAGGKVWVSTENEVDVFSTAGAKLGSVTGLLGASDLVASADGKAVYVAVSQDARIATLSTATMAQTATWTTSPCPVHLGLAAGRLFYGYGCEQWAGALGSVSLADGSAGPILAEGLYSAPRVSGAGNTLVAGALGLSSTDLGSWTAAADGTATKLGNLDASTVYDFAVSPDGADLIVTGYGNGYTIDRYKTSDLSAAGTFEMGSYPKAVGYSPDGTHFAGALGTSYQGMLRVFDATSGSLSSNSRVYEPNTSINPSVLAGTLQYSADGKLVYGVAQDGSAAAKLVTATALRPGTAKVTVSVTSPKKYGTKVVVRITKGRPKTRMTVNVASSDTSTTRVTKVSDAKGTVTIPIAAKFNGRITVTQAGDLRNAATTTSAKAFTVPAKVSYQVTGAYSSSKGMQHFHKLSAIKIYIKVQPQRNLTATHKAQAKIGGKWKTVTTVKLTAAGDGSSYIYFASANKKLKYRVTTTFTGDSYNSRSATAVSKTIIID